MNQYFIYLIEVSISLTLYYLIYLLLVKNETFHQLKRYVLLASILLSLLIPQLPASKWTRELEKTILPQETVNADISQYRDTFEKIVFGSIPDEVRSAEETSSTSFLGLVILGFYIVGVIYMLSRVIHSMLQILRLLNRQKKTSYGKYTIVELPENYSTFSFFKYIFYNGRDLEKHEREDVMLHEVTHLKQGHSFDLMIIEICKIFFWFNPIIWLYKRSLIVVHEYLADSSIVDEKDSKIEEYQSLLLKQYLSKVNIELAHPFNFSLIKLRIKMMTKQKSKWWAKYKVIFVLPVFVLSLMAFANANIEISQDNQKKKKISEPFPAGGLFIPMGSYELNRTDGKMNAKFDVDIDAFWMKETEVRVWEYMDYLEALKKDSSAMVYKAALPDMNLAPYHGYFESREYKKFPIVGVSLEQAQNYCKWLTMSENEKFKKKGKPPVADYRLPSEVEWVYASFGGMDPTKIEKPAITPLSEVVNEKTNDFGLIDMYDNVSEWTYTYFDPELYMSEIQNSPAERIDQIVVKGNNYKDSAKSGSLILDGNDSYDYVGFRWVRTYLGDQYGKD
jgi:formylglycine-generating enzyme required for sulfatase activity